MPCRLAAFAWPNSLGELQVYVIGNRTYEARHERLRATSEPNLHVEHET